FSLCFSSVSPEVTLLQKDSSSPVVCHAKGFFPREVKISWKKNGKDLNENMELTETLPNHDGTFQKRSILTVSPEELDKNEYTCVVHHSGLEKDLVLRMADRRVLNTGRRNLTLKGKKCFCTIIPYLSCIFRIYSCFRKPHCM
uniref:Ig-like domain-containing protein n=1 Tax=Electrophorus electricus TaxID=8005 RepID=A0A4W4E2S5_ELEEL